MTTRTERTTQCGNCFHPVAPHPWASWTGHAGDGRCLTTPLAANGKLVQCPCTAPVANRFQELSDAEQAAEIMSNAQRRA